MGLTKTWYCDAPNCGEFSSSPQPEGWHINAVFIGGATGQKVFEYPQLWFCSYQHASQYFQHNAPTI